ncbi:MAG: hypothetical protein IRY91_12600 [Gemmatimonadaceae bacterium]|nr:hypothetical protein [Gemmatimonadaceae bacterium]
MPAALAATRVSVAGLLRGRDLSGEALLALDEDVVALTTTRGRIAIRIGAIEGVRSTATTLELYLERGDTIQLSGSTAVGELAGVLERRVYTLPELTLSLRTFGSRGAAGPEHDRFFAPLLAALRAAHAAGEEAREGVQRALDAAALRERVTAWLRAIGPERFPREPPEQRALEAELRDVLAPLFASLDALERAQRELAACDDAERFARWRAWSRALRGVFESADACWRTLADVLVPSRRGELTRWQRFRRWMRGAR